MARQVVTYTVEGGRDHGKTFKITEMPASQAEWWAMRLMIALARGNVDVPEGLFNMGWEAIAIMGIKGIGGLSERDAKPLLDEMFSCITIQPGADPAFTRALVENDIEDTSTRLKLREAWISLHLGFSVRDRLRTSIVESATNIPSGANIATFPASQSAL